MWECQASYVDNQTKRYLLLNYFLLEENKRTSLISQNKCTSKCTITYVMPKQVRWLTG